MIATLRGAGPSPFQQFRSSDVEMAARYETPAPAPRDEAATPVAATARLVRVVARVEETHDVTTLTLHLADRGPRMRFSPGQFITVAVERDGVVVRRCYSLSGTPTDGEDLSITVKATPGGQLSPWLQAEVAVGDTLQIEPPAGRFGTAPSPNQRRDIVLIGGGSGVTPLFSVLRSALSTESESRVLLLDGNRSEADIIFRGRLDELAATHPDRLEVVHVVDTAGPEWTGPTGRLDAEVIAALLDGSKTELVDPAYLVCGPAPMMLGARELLESRGVPPERVILEHYDRPGAAGLDDAEAGSATIRVAGAEASVVVPAGGSLLQAGRDAGLSMPSSCTVGGCAACKVRVLSGEVRMAEPNCLTADEVADGWALACVARPVGNAVVEVPAEGS